MLTRRDPLPLMLGTITTSLAVNVVDAWNYGRAMRDLCDQPINQVERTYEECCGAKCAAYMGPPNDVNACIAACISPL